MDYLIGFVLGVAAGIVANHWLELLYRFMCTWHRAFDEMENRQVVRCPRCCSSRKAPVELSNGEIAIIYNPRTERPVYDVCCLFCGNRYEYEA